MLQEGVHVGDRIVIEGTGKLQPGAKVVAGKLDGSKLDESKPQPGQH